MGQIYKAAWRVCVWLGQPDEQSCDTHSVLGKKRPMDTYDSMMWSHSRIEPTRHAKGQSDEWKRTERDLPYFQTWYDMISSSLVRNDSHWWTRAWVYQEHILAKKVLWCTGPYQYAIPAPNFSRFLRNDRLSWGGNMSLVSNDFAGYLAPRANSRRLTSLHHHAYASSLMAATEPRDKVYSLLGISERSEVKQITPDYTKPVHCVFAEATYACILGPTSLQIFQGVPSRSHYMPSVPGLPTWALDWQKTRNDMLLRKGYIHGKAAKIAALPLHNAKVDANLREAFYGRYSFG
jgi:hypothetical protein